jgi:transcription antitermination factor NusG
MASSTEKTWYPVYTRARAEKKIEAWLTKHGIECYLPLKKVLRQWSDRKKWVTAPLFSSYLFVKISMSEYLEVLNTPGVARFVWFEGKPVPIAEKQILTIKLLLAGEIDLESVEDNFEPGDQVTIDYGTLKGIAGELIDYRGKKRILIRINEIGKNLVIEVPLAHVRKTI